MEGTVWGEHVFGTLEYDVPKSVKGLVGSS